MERRVKIHQDQQITDTDLNNMGEFTRSSLDHIVNDGIESGRKFWGFPVTESGPLEVTVGAGRFYNLGQVFYRDDEGGVVLSVANFVPAVTKRIVTVAVWGNKVDTNVQPRTFLTDVDTLQTEAEAVATESRRHAEINLVAGVEAVEPQPPVLDANVIAVAYITLTPGGIESIQAVEENRIISVSANNQKIKELELWRNQAGAAIDTLRSDLAVLADRTRGLIRRSEINGIASAVAELKDVVGLPDDLTTFAADHFLDRSECDDEHPDWLARIEEGVRFPAAQAHTAQLALLNQFEERVKVVDGLMLPTYSEVLRLSAVGNDAEVSISQYQFQTIEVTKKKRSQTRTRYGESMWVCTNSEWWKSGHYDARTGVFTRDGQSFNVVYDPAVRHPNDAKGTFFYRLTQFWVDTVEEEYTDVNATTESVSGACIGQTFLNAQDGWLTKLRLYFTRVASTGDVRVMITETTGGAPDLDKVIADVTVAAADLRAWPLSTDIPIGPVHLKQGRYAIVLMTPGNHFVAVVQNNKYAEGQFFYNLNEFWFMADAARDLSFQLLFAEFASTRAEVQMEPLTLENGIANIDLLVEAVRPNGTEIHYEIQLNGEWRRLDEFNTNLLNGLPALLPFRIVFVGTTDNHAGIVLGAPSTSLCWRPRTDFSYVSATRELGTPCDQVEVRLEVEWWNEERHNLDIKLLTGETFDTEVAADSIEERDLPPLNNVYNRKEFRAQFSLVAPVEEYKILAEGTTDNALVTYHISKRIDIAWAAA